MGVIEVHTYRAYRYVSVSPKDIFENLSDPEPETGPGPESVSVKIIIIVVETLAE